MKKCAICKQPNATKNSTCSIACRIELMKTRQLEKRKKADEQRKDGVKAKKQKTVKAILKEKAWELFSRYIRKKYADASGIVKCVTCGVEKPWKEMQAGHAVGGRGGFVLLNERVVRPQCYGCNCPQKGKYPEFMLYLIEVEKSMTAEEYLEIVRESHRPHRLKESDYEDAIKSYTEKLKALDNVP